MDKNNFITNTELPLTQNFKLLKEEGISYIHEHMGNEWTNLNASDPGVTILEQVCFALTELSYCNDFPIEDLLTTSDGTMKFDDQFYSPQEILTTTPITIYDYRKFIIDSVKGIQNVVILPVTNCFAAGIYRVYLWPEEKYNTKDNQDELCKLTYFQLNKCRNIGEFFITPMILLPEIHYLSGEITIYKETEQHVILAEIDQAIKKMVFPVVKSKSYSDLAKDNDINEVFNGPLLQHGSIGDADLGELKHTISITEISNLIESLPGVSSVTNLLFDGKVDFRILSAPENSIIKIDLNASLKNNLVISASGRILTTKLDAFNKITDLNAHSIPVLGNTTDIDQPKGTFRDINSYYSIQHTFPEIYAVGADSTLSNASNFQIAQSKQLKGYLTLFDQVLANQFSQLANISNLFSFKNSNTALPSELERFNAGMDRFEKANPEFPIPYLSFSPTYFYQSVYEIPHVKPLLKHNDTFDFSIGLKNEAEAAQKSWINYQTDPYNPYITGLMNFIVEEGDNLERRNNILDNLLSRHGESPVLINSFIYGAIYTGDQSKDQIIFKSLYLQNLGLLSYFRSKAYNFITAVKLDEELPVKSIQNKKEIFGRNTTDFLIDLQKIDDEQRLTINDFSNYAALELKLNLLFGLEVLYNDFIADNFEDETETELIRIALWLSSARKGFLMLEEGLLAQQFRYELILQDETTGLNWKVDDLDFELTNTACFLLNSFSAELINHTIQQGILLGDKTYYYTALTAKYVEGLQFRSIEETGYGLTVKVKSVQENELKIDFSESSIHFVFPSFVPSLNTPAFKTKLKIFLEHEIPDQLTYQCHFIDQPAFKKFISTYVSWHNSINYKEESAIAQLSSQEKALAVLLAINQFKEDNNA